MSHVVFLVNEMSQALYGAIRIRETLPVVLAQQEVACAYQL